MFALSRGKHLENPIEFRSSFKSTSLEARYRNLPQHQLVPKGLAALAATKPFADNRRGALLRKNAGKHNAPAVEALCRTAGI
jgi:hypothetical protein